MINSHFRGIEGGQRSGDSRDRPTLAGNLHRRDDPPITRDTGASLRRD